MGKKNQNICRVSVATSQVLRDRLDAVAAKTGLSPSEIVRRALLESIQSLEGRVK
jgi:metal-responsive CopG/Arc/MetJ family transcriptional regulator